MIALNNKGKVVQFAETRSASLEECNLMFKDLANNNPITAVYSGN
jgi:hypothetical protein